MILSIRSGNSNYKYMRTFVKFDFIMYKSTICVSLLGEDRWLSYLLLKSGWVLDYCSLAEVSTLCPETFDGFFQQRRRWIMSSFANTCSLIKDFWNIRHFNYKLSVLFFAYLIISVFFMVIR